MREAGFKGIWASGLTISAQFGVRDNNEASWTQVVDTLEFMADASDLPILLDGDTGYGNFNNMRRLVRKLEQRGIAGVCIEDKQFPKTNSFLNGERQPLADIEEFVGKIAAGKDTQQDAEFFDRRPRRGADRGLGHGGSACAAPRPIVWPVQTPSSFTASCRSPTRSSRSAQGMGPPLALWSSCRPAITARPPRFSARLASARSFGRIICLRAAASAMQSVAKEISDSQTLVNVEDRMVSVNEDLSPAGCGRVFGGGADLFVEWRRVARGSRAARQTVARVGGDDRRSVPR